MSEQINFVSVKNAVENCCRHGAECSTCQGKDCLIGFAKIVSEYANCKKALSIPDGIKLVPTRDYKLYDADMVATALASINNECKNCMDNHDDNCVVNIIRSSLEVALFGEHVEFTGNPLIYVMNLSKINPTLGDKVMQEYRALKNG